MPGVQCPAWSQARNVATRFQTTTTRYPRKEVLQMQRPMSEPAAWDFLARLWSAAVPDPSTALSVRLSRTGKLSRTRMYSLCHCIRGLHELGLISADTLRSMLARYRRHKPRRQLKQLGFWGYLWPLNEAGASARAEFCRKLAALARASTPAQDGAPKSRAPLLCERCRRALAG
jgi:hypothetical protein